MVSGANIETIKWFMNWFCAKKNLFSWSWSTIHNFGVEHFMALIMIVCWLVLEQYKKSLISCDSIFACFFKSTNQHRRCARSVVKDEKTERITFDNFFLISTPNSATISTCHSHSLIAAHYSRHGEKCFPSYVFIR